MWAKLFAANCDFHDDLIRNIPGVRVSQDLFDDLSDDPADWRVAISAELASQPAARAPGAPSLIHRPFDYGTVISYSFDSAHWLASRYSDGTTYGVWYGSTDARTTVHETAWHWHRFVCDSYPTEDREIRTERRLFAVRCDAVLVDLRDQAKDHPDLVHKSSYAYTQKVGRYAHEQGLNGLLAPSARCEGVNGVLLRPERLSDVRERGFLTYRMNVVRDTLRVERTPDRTWMRLQPGKGL